MKYRLPANVGRAYKMGVAYLLFLPFRKLAHLNILFPRQRNSFGIMRSQFIASSSWPDLWQFVESHTCFVRVLCGASFCVPRLDERKTLLIFFPAGRQLRRDQIGASWLAGCQRLKLSSDPIMLHIVRNWTCGGR